MVVIYQPLWEYLNIFIVPMGVLVDFCCTHTYTQLNLDGYRLLNFYRHDS